MNYAWGVSYETSFIGEVLCGCRLLEWLYLPTDCIMSRSMGAAKSGLRWMNMDRTTTARPRVSSSYSSSTAAQSRHLGYHIDINQLNIRMACFRYSCVLIHPPVRHCGRLLIDELLGCRDKHADCAGCREQAGLCRTYKGNKRSVGIWKDSAIRCWMRFFQLSQRRIIEATSLCYKIFLFQDLSKNKKK